MEQPVGVACQRLQRFIETERLSRLASSRQLAQPGRHHRPDQQVARHRRRRQIHVGTAEGEEYAAENRDEYTVRDSRPTYLLEIIPATIEPFDRLTRGDTADFQI